MPVTRHDRSQDQEKSYIIEYINAMSLELANLAERAGCEPLSRHLRDAPAKSGSHHASADR